MIIRAELKCKQAGCEADPCAVDKVIELPSPRFQQFSRTLLADYDFIAENKDAIQRDEDTRHCLLILDAEGKDGFRLSSARMIIVKALPSPCGCSGCRSSLPPCEKSLCRQHSPGR